MRGFAKFWFGAFVLAMIFYYIPVYLFSNNLEEAIMSLKFKGAAHVALINAVAPGMNEDDAKEKIDELTDQAVKSGHFDTGITLGDALKSNPNVQSSDLVYGTSVGGMISPIDPIYHDMDIGLRIKFRDGSGVILVFDAIGKSFLGGHGAKVFHVQDGFRFTPDGKNLPVYGGDSLAGLVLMAFAKDQNALPGMYNKFFGTKVPIGQNAGTNSGSLGQLLANAQSNDSSAPAGGPNNLQPQAVAQQAATPSPPASVPGTSSSTASPGSAVADPRVNLQGVAPVQAPSQQAMQQALQQDAGRTPPATAGTVADSSDAGGDWPPMNGCMKDWSAAYIKERDSQGLDDTISIDQAKEWQTWCAQGKEAPATH